MIVVEGLDNTGKTTLVESLQQVFPGLTMRPSIGNKHDLKVIRKQAEQEAWAAMSMVLADRSRIISEYVYNPVLNNRPIAYPFRTFMEYITEFSARPHVIIHCWRHTSKLVDTWNERDQLSGVREHVAELDARYWDIMAMLSFMFKVQNNPSPIIHYNYEGTSTAKIELAIRTYIQQEAR